MKSAKNAKKQCRKVPQYLKTRKIYGKLTFK